MRLIAIPLARARPGIPPVSTFLAQRAPLAPSFVATRPAPVGDAKSSESKAKASSDPVASSSDLTRPRVPTPAAPPPAEDAGSTPEKGGKLPLTSRIMNKAADFWVSLGREDQKSTLDWKRRTYVTGERLMDRIEYEEWALKGVDPALGPSLTDPAPARREEQEGQAAKEENSDAIIPRKKLVDVSLLYPPTLMQPKALITALTKMTASRQPHHRQRLIWSIVGMPFTIPFMLVPVIPNLPFFYLAWRAWSHWRALQSSKYLAALLAQGRIVPAPSSELDQILSSSAPAPAVADKTSESVKEEEKGKASSAAPSPQVDALMLLKEHHIKALTDEFKMDRQLSIDLHRARLQTIKAIQEGKLDKLEAAAKLGDEEERPSAASEQQTQQ